MCKIHGWENYVFLGKHQSLTELVTYDVVFLLDAVFKLLL